MFYTLLFLKLSILCLTNNILLFTLIITLHIFIEVKIMNKKLNLKVKNNKMGKNKKKISY